MKVVVDNKIPYVREAIETIADEVVFAAATDINNQLIKNADALIIRTRTRCDRELLTGSRVRFIATATIGYDHIDTEYCEKAGIKWANAPGCNSSSVKQYIDSTFSLLKIKNYTFTNKTIGIVGVGNVGRKVELLARGYGMNVLLNDPPREATEGKGKFVSLKELAEKSDIITFHTPLYREGKYKTYHLANQEFFRSLRKQPIIINTSRGEVMDTTALLNAMEKNKVSDAIIDVWENEPDINRVLLEQTFLGTPHIAGYSADGKANATRMSLNSLCEYFRKSCDCHISPPAPENKIIQANSYEEAVLKIYNPDTESVSLKKFPELFESFRENYPVRREKSAYEIIINNP